MSRKLFIQQAVSCSFNQPKVREEIALWQRGGNLFYSLKIYRTAMYIKKELYQKE